MNEQEKVLTKQWAERWAGVGPELEKMSIEHDAKLPLSKVIPQFNDALRAALTLHPTIPYSGLIDQQQYFRRLRG